MIGLLFVAVSVAPERVFGRAASGEQTYRASSAFFVLANGLFVSLGALLPSLNLANILLPAGAAGLISMGLLILDLRRERRWVGFNVLLLLGSIGIYAGEVWNALSLLRHPDSLAVIDAETYVLLAGYVVGLARAWDLVGGRSASTLMTSLLHPSRPGRDHADGASTTDQPVALATDAAGSTAGLTGGDAATRARDEDGAEQQRLEDGT